MAMMRLPDDFRDFLRLLHSRGVEYLVVGGYAVAHHECYDARVRDVVDGVPIDIISLRHLKENTKAAVRHRDLDDLESLP